MKKVIMAEFFDYNSVFKFGANHYAKLFAQNGYKVLWLMPTYNLFTYFHNKDEFKIRKEYNNDNFIKLDNNIYTYSPRSLFMYGNKPIFRKSFMSKLTLNATRPFLRKVLEKNGFDTVDILWLTNPKYYYLKDIIKYKKLMHRCGDDQEEFNKGFTSYIDFERKITKEADEVFMTSYDLIEKNKNLRKDIKYLPNGVEIDNFIRKEYIVPKEFELNKKYKCIYVGAIDTWFDKELIVYCANRLKNIDFYLIGPQRVDLGCLKNSKNIFLLGPRDYKQIPNYLYYSDVAIIPFKVNKLTDSVTPIKLYEYMSVGLNVISTNFKEMNYINSSAYIAKNYDEFCKYILESIKNKEKNKEKNVKFAKENTWGKRFKDIQKYL